MYWTFELADYLNEAPWPATKKELLDFCMRTCAPIELLENIQELPDDKDILYYAIEDLWVDKPQESEYYYNDEDDNY